MIPFYEKVLAELFIGNLRLQIENDALNEILREDVEKDTDEDAADGVPDRPPVPDGLDL